jgi:hypothetical protein
MIERRVIYNKHGFWLLSPPTGYRSCSINDSKNVASVKALNYGKEYYRLEYIQAISRSISPDEISYHTEQ